MPVVHYSFSQRGSYHRRVGDPYEDFSSEWWLPQGRAIAVADGMGSCVHAALGSRCAARAAGRHVALCAPEDSASPTGQLCAVGAVSSAFSAADNALVRLAHAKGCAIGDLGTTLMLASFEGPSHPLCYGFVGDGVMIAYYSADGSVELLEQPQRGPDGGTYWLHMSEGWMFGSRFGVTGLLVTTDGLLDAFAERDADGLWHPTPLAARLLEAPRPKEELDELLGATSGTDMSTRGIWASTDDRTAYLAWWLPEHAAEADDDQWETCEEGQV